MTANSDKNTSRTNVLWEKSQGDTSNLSFEEKSELLKLLSNDIERELKQKLSTLYPRHTLLGAFLQENIFQERTTQQKFAKKAGISTFHLSKIINNQSKIGLETLKKLHSTLDIDGNLLIKWS